MAIESYILANAVNMTTTKNATTTMAIHATSLIGINAVKELIEKTGIDPLDVDLVICATVTPDVTFPDTANLIAHNTGMKNAFSYDIAAACSGFLFALTTGAKFIESGMHKKVIVVGADKMSSIINYED